ncbi:MAG: sensor histidine kinase [Candidatus Binatia bacterium]
MKRKRAQRPRPRRADRRGGPGRRSARGKDPFLETLSHELRTPLSTALMQAQLLRRGVLDAEGVRRAGEAIERAVETQVRLIDDLVDASRIASGELPLKHEPVDPVAAVKSAIASVSATAREKLVALEAAFEEPVVPVSADPARLRQVLTNLLVNAVQLSPKDGCVRVAVETRDGRARISVANGGVGIAPEILPYVFDPFARADLTRTTAWGGLGLRLGIVRELVERQGGAVTVDSAGTDKGAVFTVTLPLA